MRIELICEGTLHTTVLKTARHTSYPFTSVSLRICIVPDDLKNVKHINYQIGPGFRKHVTIV